MTPDFSGNIGFGPNMLLFFLKCQEGSTRAALSDVFFSLTLVLKLLLICLYTSLQPLLYLEKAIIGFDILVNPRDIIST